MSIHNENNSFVENYKNFVREAKLNINPSFPKRIMLESSNACNHKCIFCAHCDMQRDIVHLDVPLAEKIINRAYELGARECALHGGSEPFLHPQLFDIVSCAKKNGYSYVYITTNGASCSWNRMQKVLEAGIDSIKFSINGGNQKDYYTVHRSDSFEKACAMLNNVLAWRKNNNSSLKVYISFIECEANKTNSHLLESLFPEVDEIAYFSAIWCGKPVQIPLEQLQKRPFEHDVCMEPFNRLTISAEGYVRACCNDSANLLIMGDLREQDILTIWQNELYTKLRKMILEKKILLHSRCYNCVYGLNESLLPLSELV